MMDAQTSRQRIMDNAAIGPQQFTLSQRTYIDSMPHVGRTDPQPNTDFHLSRQTQTPDGTCYYEDGQADGDQGWIFPDDMPWGTTTAAVRPS
jgi:hypothetical protein